MNNKYQGIIVNVVEQKGIGFIRPEHESHDVFFHFSVVDKKDRPFLKTDARVKYKYDVKKHKALKIWLYQEKSTSRKDIRIVTTRENTSKEGQNVMLEEKTSYKNRIQKVKYTERNIRGNIGKLFEGERGLSMHYKQVTARVCKKKMSIYILQPVENDEVIFTKPTETYDFFEIVKIKRYNGPRSAEECMKYFENLDEDLNSDNWCKVIEDLCENKAQWEFFGSMEISFQENFDNFFISLLHVINSVIKRSKLFHKPLIQNLLDTILKTKIFRESTIQLQNLMKLLNLDKEQDIFLLFKEFTKSVSKFVPPSLSKMRIFLHAVSNSVPSKNMAELMMYNWNLIAKTEVGSSLDEKWYDIPVMITDEEINGDLLYKDKYLSPVKSNTPYLSEDEYMDTYLRLLRAECFSSIQKGIIELKRGELDSRDMNVYSEVCLVGHAVSYSGFTIAVKFKSQRAVRDWNKTQQLMYGNLLCLSTDINFTEPIWATVENRDPELLGKESIILLELCDFNSLKPSSIIIHMQCFSKNIWMVESPTYFNSLKPVLKAFQSLSIHDMALKTEIVFTDGAEARHPSYITDSFKIILDEEMEHYESQLEKSQMEAFKYALLNRVAVIQGPPGTGKTYLGTKIVEMLLRINGKAEPSQKIIEETVKIECTNKEMEPKQTSSEKKDSENAEFDSGNDQSKLWKTDEQISGIYSERVRSTLKDICDESIVSTNLTEERDKIDSSYKDCENEGTVSAHSDQKKEIIDLAVEDQSVKLNTPAKRVEGCCHNEEFDYASEDLRNNKECSKDDSDKNKFHTDGLQKSIGVVAVQREGFSNVAIGCQKDKLGGTSSVVTFSVDRNKYCCNESSDVMFEDIPLPILLLTYKNHALDEFLLKMVESFGMSNVLRIGGRSKEPKLDECNLNKQFSKCKFTEELFYVKREIDELQEQVDEIMELLQSSSQISVISLLQLLNDRQVKNLLQESKLSKAEQSWLQRVFNILYHEGNYVGEFLLYLYQEIDLETDIIHHRTYKNFNLKNIWERALNDWLPPVSRIRQLRDISRKFTKMRNSVQHADYDKNSSEDEELSDIDQDYLKEEQEKGMSESIAFSQCKKRSRIKIMKPSHRIICELSDFPADLTVDYHFLKESKLWQLDEVARIKFISSLLKSEVTEIKEQFEATLDGLYLKINNKKFLENQIKLDICKNREIVGMTITSASINSDLIKQLAPKIVIVEEAAEILEPSLVAALNEEVEHLILIGDHQQLRPRIDTYELRKKFHFDISLMERLINSGKINFKTLEKQCRMRPEFSIMLRDIYPNLKDSESIVLNEHHKQHYCINKSMFFWTHDFLEEKSRSYTNEEEAKMVVSLTVYLLRNGVPVDRISILAPYLGQTKILCQKLKQAKQNYPQLIPEKTPQVSTIDMFQGDENDFIIVSLVRGNKSTGKNIIGFMSEMNRRCVTQSRAKRGMFFVGNCEAYACSSTWLPLISKMKQEGCYGKYIPIQCPKHRDLNVTQIGDAETLNRYIDSPDLICNLPCGEQLPCKLHECQKPCMLFHDHQKCTRTVSDKFSDCGHNVIRKCCEELRHLRCQTEIFFSFKCKHLGMRKCSEDYATKSCKKDCEKIMDCGLHQCKKICGKHHSHLKCNETVNFTFDLCNHRAVKLCHENPESKLCQTKVKKKLPCNHTVRIACHKPLPTTCPQKVDYKFPDCLHPSPSKKRCSEEITDVCLHKLKHVCPNCKRESSKKCSIPFICEYPCLRKRQCGHQCGNTCSEDCEKGKCQVCEKIEIQSFQKAAFQKRKEIREDVVHKRRAKGLVLKEIDSEVNPAEYDKIKNQLIMYFHSKQDMLPKILKIEKVDNAALERNYEMSKTKSFGTFEDYMFYECDGNNIEHITKNGFSLQENLKMGIHFLAQFSESSNKQETQGPKKILLCKVLIGKSLKIDSKKKINMEQTGLRRFDSVYLRETSSGKTKSCIIFSRDQSFPEYIIHYDCVPIPTLAALPDLKAAEGPITKISVEPSRNQNESDPMQAHFMKVEAIFYRLQKMYRQKSTLQIKSVDFIVYSKDFPLKVKFEEKKKELEEENFREEILAFHGTDTSNIEKILNENLNPNLFPKNGRQYGRGSYFSEFPDFSRKYGEGLILFRVLPGKEFEDETKDDTWMQKGFHSKKVRPNTDRYAEQIIIQDPSQFLPYCVYHFKDKYVKN